VVALFVSCLSLSVAQAKDGPARSGAGSGTARNDVVKVVNASRVIREITALPKRKIPPVLLKEAAVVVIIPKAYKQAFMVKGGNSGGVLLVRDKAGTWSSPVFVTISGGTLGWQIVGDPMDVVLLFRTSKQVDSILKGKFALDTKISIVPGRVAPTMKGASKEELTAEVTSYVLSHGAFVEDAVVAGTTLQPDAAANDAYYGKAKIYAGDILSGSVATPGEEFTSLQKLLDDYAADR
jgi:lipid-binding SYLF domain-containing protein